MPLYEYECGSCGQRVEKIQKFSDPPLATCPACGGPVKKLPSSPAIQFKGSGWYVTDYASKSASNDTKAGNTKSDSSGEKKTDTSSTPASGSSSSDTKKT